MSIEGSVTTSASSRIRQFGLYRSIDAKTEEFLRLSRKRQIKQGCACAVISTAITVTVVIVVLLVYTDHGINTDSNQQSMRKPKWFGLMNDSLASSLEENFSKSKLNFDRNTIKLLPLLIKALKQNRYLEKIIEDYSSSSPIYEGKVTTEFSFKKDLFTNANSWLKKPTTKLYSIEYKTSPVIYFKKPSKNSSYFTKMRKIRDYKRIMEYVDKMISDKAIDHSLPIVSVDNDIQTKKPNNKIHRTSNISTKTNINIHSKQSNPPQTKSKNIYKANGTVSCKCPKQIGLLLNKIVSSIQKLVPGVKFIKTTSCPLLHHKHSTPTNKPTRKSTKIVTISTTTTPMSSNLVRHKITYPLLFSEFNNMFQKEDQSIASIEFDNIFNKPDTSQASLMTKSIVEKQILSKSDKYKIKKDDAILSAVKEYFEPVKVKIAISTNQPLLKNIDTIKNGEPETLVTSEKYIYSNNYPKEQLGNEGHLGLMPNEPTENPTTDVTMNNIKHSHYDMVIDDHITTTSEVEDYANDLNIYTFNNNKILPTSTKNLNITRNLIYPKISPFNASNLTDLTKYITLIGNYTSEIKKISSSHEETTTNPEYDSTASTNEINKISINKTKSNPEIKKQEPYHQNVDNTVLEDDTYKAPRDDDYQEEYNVKPNESLVPLTSSLLNNTMLNERTTEKENDEIHKPMKNNEGYYKLNSMIPENRPTYLEVYRNGWRREENEDYDLNLKYNIFDLL